MGVLQMGAMFMTAGASTAIGSAILGTGATGAATLGGAIVGAGMNVLTSAATGNDITAGGVLTGAAIGGIGANSMDIAANIVGGGDAIAGVATLSNIASEMGIKVADVGRIVSGAVANGIGAAAAGNDVVESITKNLVSSGLGAYAGGLVDSIDPGNLDTAVKAASGVAKLGVATAMNGGDITTALQNNLPSIVMNSISLPKDASANDIQKAEIDALDPMGQYLANYLANPDAGETGQEYYPTAGVTIENGRIISDAEAFQIPKYVPDMVLEDFSPGTDEEDVSPELDPTGSLANPTTSPLSPDPRQLDEAFEYYDNLIAQGVEPALASKMSGYTPTGAPGALTVGTSDGLDTGSPTGSPIGTPDGDGTSTRGILDGNGVSDLGTINVPAPSGLTAGELVVEGNRETEIERDFDYIPEIPDRDFDYIPEIPDRDFDYIPDEEPAPTPPASTVGLPKVTLPTPSTTTSTPKMPGALPTATTTTAQAPSGYNAPSSGTSQSGGIPTPISGQSLAAAPVYGNTQILQQLKQLDPKLLSMVAPHLSGQSGPTGLSALSSQIPQQATGGNMQQSNPYNTLFQTMLADKGGTNPSYGAPMFSAASSMLGYATGGGAKMDDYLTHLKKLRDKEQTGALMSSGLKLLGAPAYNTMGFKDGGHIPEFKTGTTGHYVKGAGDGQSDDIPAMLADGEYVFDADTVASLGNGSSDAGAQLLDHFREAAREHKRSAPVDKIPPKASPLAYMKEALKRHARG